MTTTEQAPAAPTFRSVLRLPDFRWLALGLGLSTVGVFAYHVALYALVYEATRSPAWAAATTLGRFLPSLLFSTYGGVLAERFERRRVLIVTDTISLVVMLGLAAVGGLGLPVVLAIVLASLISMLGTLYLPASMALVPDIAQEHQLATANAFLRVAENVVTIAGPAIGAAAVGFFGVEAGFLFCALMFLASVLCSSRLRVRSTPSDVTEGGDAGVVRQIAVGFRALGQSRTAATLVAAAVGAAFFFGVDTVLFLVVSDERLGIGANGYGLLLAGLGAGGILVAPLVGRLAERPRLATIIGAALLLYTVPTAFLVFVTDPAVAIAVQIPRGAGAIIVDVLAMTAMQRSLPSEMTARVLGIFGTLMLASISLGALATPLLLNFIGLDATLVVLGGVGVVVVLLAYPQIRVVDREAAARLVELAPRIEMLRRLGIFADASRPGLESLAASAETQHLPPGTTIVEEGETSDALYVITEGQVDVSAQGELPAPEHLRTLGPGEYFGEIGLLAHGPRTATVRATTDVVVERIPGEDFLAALNETRPTAAFMEVARMRLAQTDPSRTLDA